MAREVLKFILVGMNQIETIYEKLKSVNRKWSNIRKVDIKNGKRLKALKIIDGYITPAVIIFTEKNDESDLYNINLLQIKGYILVDDYNEIEHIRWNKERNDLRELMDAFVDED